MKIDPSERLILIGKTGSGKSEWAKHLLRQISNSYPVVIIDPKEQWLGRRPIWAKGREPGTIDRPHLISKFNSSFRVQCLQPDEEDDDRLAVLCRSVLKHGNTFLFFDETEGIATANHVPSYIRRIWKTGRSHGIGAWAATQVPTGIPKLFKSQAEHFVIFKVGDEDAKLASTLAHVPEEMVRKIPKYHWIYYNTDMDHGELHPPIPLELRPNFKSIRG